jgi:membrane fusion protein (multidrug efflux system)
VVSPIDGIAGIAQAQVGDLVSGTSGTLTTVSTLDPIRDYHGQRTEYLALRKRISGSGARVGNCNHPGDGTTYPHHGDFYLRIVRSIKDGRHPIGRALPQPECSASRGRRFAPWVQCNTALISSQRAVTEQQGTYLVDVVDSDDRVAIRPVKVGPRMDTMWVIQNGLKPGERVAVAGQQNLRPGLTVRPKPFSRTSE